jgi:hypothetical protein
MDMAWEMVGNLLPSTSIGVGYRLEGVYPSEPSKMEVYVLEFQYIDFDR